MDPQFVSRLEFLSKSLLIDTSKYDYTLDIEQDGSYSIRYSDHHRVTLRSVDQIIGFLASATVTRIALFDHDTDEETVLYHQTR